MYKGNYTLKIPPHSHTTPFVSNNETVILFFIARPHVTR
jgi:hypothetical protein